MSAALLFLHPGHSPDAGSSGHFILMSSPRGEAYDFFTCKQNAACSFLLNNSEVFCDKKDTAHKTIL